MPENDNQAPADTPEAEAKGYALYDLTEQRYVSGVTKDKPKAAETLSSPPQVKAPKKGLSYKEQKELDVLKAYLPEEASEAEIEKAVEGAIAETGASSARDIGKAMKAALAALQKTGKPADGKKVNDAVRRRLSA